MTVFLINDVSPWTFCRQHFEFVYAWRNNICQENLVSSVVYVFLVLHMKCYGKYLHNRPFCLNFGWVCHINIWTANTKYLSINISNREHATCTCIYKETAVFRICWPYIKMFKNKYCPQYHCHTIYPFYKIYTWVM